MDLEEKTVCSQTLLQGRFLSIQRDTVSLPDGKQSEREYVVHPGAVMVIPILPNGDVVLEKQYRHPVKEVIIEFPAGKIDPDEEGLMCAKRELLEETGYQALRWGYMGKIYPCPGYSDEVIEVWLAKDLHAGSAQPDEGEFIDVFTAPEKQLKQWALDGTIKDSKTLAALQWLQAFCSDELDVCWVSGSVISE